MLCWRALGRLGSSERRRASGQRGDIQRPETGGRSLARQGLQLAHFNELAAPRCRQSRRAGRLLPPASRVSARSEEGAVME
jgi:hypothetical protein